MHRTIGGPVPPIGIFTEMCIRLAKRKSKRVLIGIRRAGDGSLASRIGRWDAWKF